MDLLGGLMAFVGLVGLTFVGVIAALARRRIGRVVFLAYIGYGLFVGVLTIVWLRSGGESYLFNIPGQLLGQEAYLWMIEIAGHPSSPQAHYTIPWMLRTPQVYVPASVLAWATIGLLVWGLTSLVASLPASRGAAR